MQLALQVLGSFFSVHSFFILYVFSIFTILFLFHCRDLRLDVKTLTKRSAERACFSPNNSVNKQNLTKVQS